MACTIYVSNIWGEVLSNQSEGVTKHCMGKKQEYFNPQGMYDKIVVCYLNGQRPWAVVNVAFTM